MSFSELVPLNMSYKGVEVEDLISWARLKDPQLALFNVYVTCNVNLFYRDLSLRSLSFLHIPVEKDNSLGNIGDKGGPVSCLNDYEPIE